MFIDDDEQCHLLSRCVYPSYGATARCRAFDSHNLPLTLTNLKPIDILRAYFYTCNHDRQTECSAKVHLYLCRIKHYTVDTYGERRYAVVT